MMNNHFYERPSNYARVPAPRIHFSRESSVRRIGEERAFDILEAQRHDGVHGAQQQQR